MNYSLLKGGDGKRMRRKCLGDFLAMQIGLQRRPPSRVNARIEPRTETRLSLGRPCVVIAYGKGSIIKVRNGGGKRRKEVGMDDRAILLLAGFTDSPRPSSLHALKYSFPPSPFHAPDRTSPHSSSIPFPQLE